MEGKIVFELEEGQLNEIAQRNIDVKLPIKDMYIRKINEQLTLVINSFRNKVYVVENKYINEHFIFIRLFPIQPILLMINYMKK